MNKKAAKKAKNATKNAKKATKKANKATKKAKKATKSNLPGGIQNSHTNTVRRPSRL